jgi:serine/threonine protein kinase
LDPNHHSSTNAQQKCLVLERMDGPLDTRLALGVPLGWEQRVWISLCVCKGIAYLHSLSPPMIHRDVKSQNILLVGFSSSELDNISTAKVGAASAANAMEQVQQRHGASAATPYACSDVYFLHVLMYFWSLIIRSRTSVLSVPMIATARRTAWRRER